METILFLAHSEADGTLARPAREALNCARTLAAGLPGSSLLAGLVGADVQAAANAIAACGAARFLGVAGPDFGFSRYPTDAAAAEALCRAAAATIVVAAGTSRWSRVLAGVAQRLHGRIDAHVTGVSPQEGRAAVTRWYYRQRMEATLQRSQRPWCLLVDPGCREPWAGSPGAAALEIVPVTITDAHRRTAVKGIQAPPADEQTIRPDARLLFVAGAGWTKTQSDGRSHAPEAEALILDFLAKTKASLGSTKSLVDLRGEGQAVLKFMTHLNQVGQTGSTPRHPQGLAACCHGEEPHTVGWRFINERRAINLNPNCGWAQGKADVLYVADAFAVIRQVNELLAAR
ncbi:MAG TPA: electron transfer flavoprotein subunit alpha [Opitutaceae bacterium]|nr:electron transfer flavoprotein subunit alpha [Opitutaceae bacterium]